jgi:predicted Fe-Mo cluster-binding NifX family protein
VGVELIANFVSADKHSAAFLAQVVSEESMEMLGVTLIAWSAFALLEAYGLDISVRPAAGASASVQSAGS